VLDGARGFQVLAKNVIFGNKDQFAIEAFVETGPEFGPVQGHSVVGRICVWLNGVRVGRLEEPACWLGPPCSDLVNLTTNLESLWDDSFQGLTPEAIFDRLDRDYFGALRHRLLDDSDDRVPAHLEVAEAWRFTFLINSSEAFDGWKGFLVRPTSAALMGLVLARDSQDVAVSHFQTDTFCQAVLDFSRWLRAQERRLIAQEPP
jgi:hypothetical protein